MRGHPFTVIIIILYNKVTESQWLNLYIITQFQCDIFAQTQHLLLGTSCMGSLILGERARRTLIRYYTYASLYLVSSQNPHGVTLAFNCCLLSDCWNSPVPIMHLLLLRANYFMQIILSTSFPKHRKTVGKECWYKHQVCILLEMITLETIISKVKSGIQVETYSLFQLVLQCCTSLWLGVIYSSPVINELVTC